MNTYFNINMKNVCVVLMLVGCVVLSGCTMERRTEDGALARFKFEVELLPSTASDDVVAIGNDAVKTYAESIKGTNAHDSGIAKEEAGASVVTTTTRGPAADKLANSKYRN